MSTVTAIVVATHTESPNNPIVGWVFLGVVATAVWMLFSRWSWRNTVVTALVAWAIGVTLLLVF
jgi:hypothetical protein